eukprot:TRINITY_DN2731_c0_g1_i1.p1 TRINITY_DN2731_c0_g1~~TRINITY_DN2731_c0_g1_i1.p1  ORF type:complete len:147 (-),score=40.61 TRINITY_DN2731_c0_g1_i1:54-494(-)
MSQMDQEAQEEYREVFAEFAKSKGRVNAKDLQALMRHMGTILTDAETVEVIRSCGGGDSIDLNQWLGYMGGKMADSFGEAELNLAFSAFDKDGNGYISLSELRFVLTCLGDKIDDEAVEVMLNQADPTGVGSVQYSSFIRNMMNRG